MKKLRLRGIKLKRGKEKDENCTKHAEKGLKNASKSKIYIPAFDYYPVMG